MADFVIVDTDVLIDAGRGIGEAVTCLQEIERQSSLAASVITQMELLIGCRNKTELQTVESFLLRFQLLKLTGQVSDTAVDLLRQYRLSHNLLIADALIPATALAFDAPFLSKNQRDYRFIAGLNLLAYP
ncbi:MAG TPA: type II toxin-antitoxin system VapC family toxin [Pyrinomonadaceae bacterium]